MATLSVDGIAIAEINTGSAEQLKHLAAKGLGASMPVGDHWGKAPGSPTAAATQKVTCIITLEFPRESVAM